MVRTHISDEWKLGKLGHENFDFLDACIDKDSKLFLDPCLIELLRTEWSDSACKRIDSFMREFVEAYQTKDFDKKENILSCASEPNATKLGYGNGGNGKGNTVRGLMEKFKPLEKLIDSINTIGKAQDLTVLLPGFAEDGLSDLLTNILHLDLSNYTDAQMKKYGINTNGKVKFEYWDNEVSEWKHIEKDGYLVKEKEFMLVPKQIVRRSYLFSTNQYFSRVVLERVRDDYMKEDGKKMSKKDIVESKRFSGKHWMYEESVGYTEENNDALEEYHRRLLSFYVDNGGCMSDELLDKEIYGIQI